MTTYYKHTKKESIDVPYSFCCEQCMKDSGPLIATIVGNQAEINSNFKNLNAKKQTELDQMAHKKLVRSVKDAHRNACEKQVYIKAFNDECPHCHKPQSWAISGAVKDMYTWPIALVIVGIILGAGLYFFSDTDNKSIIAIGAFAVCLVLAAGVLIFNLIKVGNKKKQTADSLQNNLPVIDWSAVQNILNEE